MRKSPSADFNLFRTRAFYVQLTCKIIFPTRLALCTRQAHPAYFNQFMRTP